VGGTYVVLKSALEAGVETFVLVSTDKAVNPSSVMGATKRLAELTVQELNASGGTQALSVRFGNVLGSNASVVPIFKQQIADGGPVTVTHKDAQRYFMSISEAAGLILQAGAVGTGGEVFVLDMGDPIKIVTLAETMVSLVGLKPYEDIEIVFTGLRPGEKLSEELRFEGEDFQPTQYEKLLVLKDHGYDGGVVKRVEEFLHDLSGMDMSQVRSRLKDLVPEYQSSVPPTSPVQGH
jgi:FlaA1/EpsC-like NDP-sugar epimerase